MPLGNKKLILKIFIIILGISLFIFGLKFLPAKYQLPRLLEQFSLLQDTQITFLGENSVEEYTAEDGQYLIIRRFDPWRFDTLEGPLTYTSTERDRVWLCIGICENYLATYHNDIDYGPVQAGDKIYYLGIDDDLDDRINIFNLNDTPFHTIEQGMVFSGELEIPSDGILTLTCNDSIGANIEVLLSPVYPKCSNLTTSNTKNLSSDYSNPSDRTYKFTCFGNDAESAQFRILNKEDMSVVVGPENHNEVINTNEFIWNYTITETLPGDSYFVECKMCNDIDCTDWGQAQ
jgi:hypothetical protein